MLHGGYSNPSGHLEGGSRHSDERAATAVRAFSLLISVHFLLS
jgi:hypothetical protein